MLWLSRFSLLYFCFRGEHGSLRGPSTTQASLILVSERIRAIAWPLVWKLPKRRQYFPFPYVHCSFLSTVLTGFGCALNIQYKSRCSWLKCSHHSQSLSLISVRLIPDTPLLVRSSSDSALAPPHDKTLTPPPEDQSSGPPETVSISGCILSTAFWFGKEPIRWFTLMTANASHQTFMWTRALWYTNCESTTRKHGICAIILMWEIWSRQEGKRSIWIIGIGDPISASTRPWKKKKQTDIGHL